MTVETEELSRGVPGGFPMAIETEELARGLLGFSPWHLRLESWSVIVPVCLQWQYRQES